MQDTREEEEGQEKHGLSFHQTQNNSVQIIDLWLRNDIKKKDKKKRKKKKTRCTILRMLTNDQKLNLELIRLGAVIPSFSLAAYAIKVRSSCLW